ncbi:MAG TPA: CapA family protein, partial [Thermosynechococcaceae cyanobacterium]
MAYSSTILRPSPVELARSGNFRAIAHWLNQILMPLGMRALVGGAKPGCLKILVELQPWEDFEHISAADRETLIRFLCHRIWQLNSALIEGVRIAVRFVGEPEILWERSVRIAAPARRHKQHRSRHLKTKIRRTSRRTAQLKTMRVLLMSGSTMFAFVIGGILAYTRAPVEQSSAVTSPQISQTAANRSGSNRPDRVRTALEIVPVTQHTQVVNPNDPTVSLLFAGDVTLSDSFADTIGKDYKRVFASMDEYRQADLAMVNLENPLTRATTKYPGKQFNFKADPDAVQVLKEGGVDLVNLANNHTMDYEAAGLLETTKTLDDAGILRVGAGSNIREARRPEIVDVKGQRVAYLGYYGEEFAATDKKAGISPIMEDRIAQDIRSLRDQVDWIVVNFHWGQEKATHPAPWQVDLAHYTVDQGADVIVGHHPHVLQGAEVYKGRPIAYSMGNFIFGGNPRSDYDTAVLKVALKDKQMRVEFLPVEVRKFQPQVVSGDRGNEILKQIVDRSTEFKQPLQSPMVLDARQNPTAPTETSPLLPTSPTNPANPLPYSSPSTSPAPPTSYPPEAAPVPQPTTQTSPAPGVTPAPAQTPPGGVLTPQPIEAPAP